MSGKPGENAGEIIDSLGKLIEDHKIIVVFQGICDVNWDVRNLHLANLFLMDSRDDGIPFISDHIWAGEEILELVFGGYRLRKAEMGYHGPSHWNSCCSVVSFSFPSALRWFQVMSHGLTEIVKPGFTNSVDYHMIAGLDSDTARSTLISINHGLLSADHVGSRWFDGWS